MEDGSSFEYDDSLKIARYGGSNLFYAGTFGAVLLIISRMPMLLYNLELINNVIPSPSASWYLFLLLGALVALVGVVLLGLGLMALMKRYGKSYGIVLFIAVVLPYIISQFISVQPITEPEQSIMSASFSSIVSIVTSVLVGIGLLTVRSQSVNPSITGITAILCMANPLIYMSSGVLLMTTEQPMGLILYFLTGFVFSFIMNLFFMLLLYTEGRTGITRTLGW